MSLRDEFADAVDAIRDLQFHATKVRQFIESFFFLFSAEPFFGTRTLYLITNLVVVFY
jgi:hypothetical protein